MDAGLKRELEAKVYAGERLTRADGEALYDSDDLAWLGRLAHHRRTELNGDRVMFNVNRHLNLTNVCRASLRVLLVPAQAGREGRVHDAHRGGRRARPRRWRTSSSPSCTSSTACTRRCRGGTTRRCCAS